MCDMSLQLPLTEPWIAHDHATELWTMSALLYAEPAWAARSAKPRSGVREESANRRRGLTGEQTLRIRVVGYLIRCTNAELAFIWPAPIRSARSAGSESSP